MKTRLAWIAAGITIVAVCIPAMALASDDAATQAAQPRAQQRMTDAANASAQATTDMSYGGTSDSRGASGYRVGKPCTPRAQCDIFFGQ
ncbi:hypothetical protein [Paraburkholderia acidisoli]|uniref:Lipoprotein n=1 Tax=Paraburkholderia acidisoli TaxID=2571748 RepID=A0A7Z2GJW4_9BURK|nr:hypothetical protein [Paraburkholderia acidisoli]QGZ63152.1 hypothetical protein FAZ98_15185 [Paraburkholderia acidisoli]